jgi:O-antigen/teichoic acid export membrane protein
MEIPAQMEQQSSLARGDLASTVGRNTIFGLAATLTYVATRLVTVPIIIRYLGLDGYGIWSIIMLVAAYMRMGSAGIKCAFQKYVAEATGTGDFDKANRLISTGTALMFALSVLAVTPVFIFSTKLAFWAGVPPKFIHEASESISLLAFIVFVANTGAGYEAIVTGAQRFDLVRKINMIGAVGEAICIVLLLHYGRGLFAMSAIMALSELSYICYCMVISRRVLPQIQIAPQWVSRRELKHFVVFAGSYQLVNLQEVIYNTILPLAVLKYFGAEVTGAYAVAGRLVQACLMPQDAFLLPILSGSSLVFAAGTAEEKRQVVLKAFKSSFALSIIPLSVICAAGDTILLAWTGRKEQTFEYLLVLMSLAGVFHASSLLQLVLYRASGKALMDNIRQTIRIGLLLAIGIMAKQLGLVGTLKGLVLTEFAGMAFMFFVMHHAFPWFKVSLLLPDFMKLTIVACATALLSVLVVSVPIPWLVRERSVALLRTCAAGSLALSAALPLLLLTKALSAAEFRVIRRLIPGNQGSE